MKSIIMIHKMGAPTSSRIGILILHLLPIYRIGSTMKDYYNVS